MRLCPFKVIREYHTTTIKLTRISHIAFVSVCGKMQFGLINKGFLVDFGDDP